MKTIFHLLTCLVFLSSVPPVRAAFELKNVVLYQPDEILKARLDSADAVAKYVNQLGTIAEEFFADTKKPETISIVVAVRPGKKARVWFVSPARKDFKELASLKEKLEQAEAPEVEEGPVALALQGDIAGGDSPPKKADGEFSPPIPAEWQDAVKDRKEDIIVPDTYLEKIWPGDKKEAEQEKKPPPGFVKHMLNPTGGHIFLPKDWHHTSQKIKAGYMWTMAKEDITKGGSYTTGVRIQMIIGVKSNSGMTAQEFLKDYAAKKQKSADKVVSTRDPVKFGDFTRTGLETLEGPHHILYSFFGSDKMDLAVVSTSGTTKELWKDHTKTFDIMSSFVLLDMKSIQEAARKADEEDSRKKEQPEKE